MRCRLVAVMIGIALSGCREGVPPFTPAERTVSGASYALTFGAGQDADPRWSPEGDTVIYHTTLFGAVPQSNGILLGVPARGGSAAPVLPDVQNIGRPLATPVRSPAGDRIAYMDLLSIDVPDACFRAERTPSGDEVLPHCMPIQPLLDSAALRVRRVGELRDITLDPRVIVRFAGTDPGHRFGSSGPWYEWLFPFQAQHRAEHAMLFRPSWAPDGERLAFSDGLSLHVWRVGEPASAVVPGTEDGVSAAWSPDGGWIAFTMLLRGDSTVHDCVCSSGRDPTMAYRTVYTVSGHVLVLVRPDGSERIELGEGEDPAWSPDGAFIYVRRGDEIVRVPRAGGAATPVPDTGRGRAPAVSPDGTRLAFSRRKNQLTPDYDIWVVSLAQQP